MKVPSNGGYVHTVRRVASNEFDPYEAIAAAMQAPVFSLPVPVSEPRSTIAPVETTEPPPAVEEPSAAIVDLGEERARRAEIDKHAELLSRLDPIAEMQEAMSNLTRQFEAANDGSVQSAVSQGITSVSSAVQGLKQELGASLRRTLASQQELVKGSIEQFRSMSQEQIGQVLSQREAEFGRMVESVLSFNKRIDSLEQTLRDTQSLMRAPKRIVRDNKGRAIGSVVDPNLGG